jgi:hypothetical protein
MTPTAEVGTYLPVGGRRFVLNNFADVAQLVEQDFRKVKVGGSIPLIGSSKYYVQVPRSIKKP